jgi:DNA-binding CsgD family transcriptional regulator/tetratricopeptide (TPR) repeat protein
MPTELLERDRDLDQLHALLRDAIAGQGSLLLLGGEAGVGKTMLVRQLCQEVQQSVRLMIGVCDPLSTPRPLGPLADIAAATGGEIEQLVASGSERTQIFNACLRELSGAWRPTLAVFEDVHWADEATFDLLRFLGRRIDSTRCLLIATYRDDEVGPTHPLRKVFGDLATASSVHRLNLAPLSAASVRQLALNSSLDGDELYRQTGGNPFYVTEVLAASGGIPETVRDAVLARVSFLSPEARQTLEVVSVIGQPASMSLLNEISSPDLKVTEECLASGVLHVSNHGLAFRHELAREAVYSAIWSPRRMQLHARVLKAFEGSPVESRDVALLAHHAEAAGDRAAVLQYAPAAARRALELRATREATAQYGRAIRFGDHLPDDQRLSLLEAYADAADLSGRDDSWVSLREDMIALARRTGDRLKESEHLGWLALTLSSNGRFVAADEAANAGLTVIKGLPEGRNHVMIYMLRASLQIEVRDFAGAIDWSERAISLAEQHGDKAGLIQSLHRLGVARFMSGDVEGGRADLERCVRLAREAELEGIVAGALAYLGFCLADFYFFADAEPYLTEAIAYTAERDLDTYQSWAMIWLAVTRFYQGRWTEAESLVTSVLGAPPLKEALTTGGMSTTLITLGRIQTRRGDSQASIAFDEVATLEGGFQFAAPILVARAEAAWLAGNRERTIAEASVALDLALKDHHRWHIGENAYWLWQAGALTIPPPEAAEPFALQIIGDWAGAAAAWAALGCPYEKARALADATDEASLRSALATFDRLGARPMAAVVTKRLRDLGAQRIPRGPRPKTRTNPAGLTERQTDILALMAEGLRNAEIADRLFLSPKTVEHHVSAIHAKLGVSSRVEAVRVATELGLVPTGAAQKYVSREIER